MKSTREFVFGLGDPVRSKLNGFSGVVIGRTEWLYGCCGYTVQPSTLDKDGNPRDSRTFDEDSLEPDHAATPLKPVVSTTGGPVPHVNQGQC